MKMKKVPMRRCAGCGQSKEKRELIRIVRTPQGQVLLDPSGRLSGRGVYVCRDQACLVKATRTKALERSLDVPVGEDVLQALSLQLEQEEKCERT